MAARSRILLCAFVVLTIAVPAVAVEVMLTLTFDPNEIGSATPQPVDGISVGGVTFEFTEMGSPSAAAEYGDPGVGTLTYIEDEVLAGPCTGTLAMTFDTPTSLVEFGVALNTIGPVTDGFTVELFDENLTSLGTTAVDTESLVAFSEGLFSHDGTPVKRAEVVFNQTFSQIGGNREFVLDNLDYLAPPPPKCGPVCDETWSVDLSPYLVNCDVTVAPGCNLTIDPGVEVQVDPGFGLVVSGTLDIVGSAGNEVLLTSSAEVPSMGDWDGVELSGGAVGTVSHTTILHADSGVHAHGAGTQATLNHVEAMNSTIGFHLGDDAVGFLTDVVAISNTTGLLIQGGSLTAVDVAGGAFTGNSQFGIHIDGGGFDPSVTISTSSIHSNLGTYNLRAEGFATPAAVIWAPDNWWGTTSAAMAHMKVYDNDDDPNSPRVVLDPFAASCDRALGGDVDNDQQGDFEDNCPFNQPANQLDTDGDGMGDLCDPAPLAQPSGPCDGANDVADGWADGDGDGWGDPCDFQPTRADSHPGAPEVCDGRDNDGDLLFAVNELVDADADLAIACGDCDDTEAEVYPCGCENCSNAREDNCDGLTDLADPTCQMNPYCVILEEGDDLILSVIAGACSGETAAGPYEVIRGSVSELAIDSGSVDLGNVTCAAGNLLMDRVTDISLDADPACNDILFYFLARPVGDPDLGTSSPGGEPRDMMQPDPACPP